MADGEAKPKAVYENRTVEGVITSFVWKQTAQQRTYAEIILDGVTYSCWDEAVGQTAEAALNHRVSAKVSRKEGSSYWNLRSLDVLGPAEAQESAPQADEGLTIRINALHAASRVWAGKGESASDVVTSLARSFEIYLMGLDVDGNGTLGA